MGYLSLDDWNILFCGTEATSQGSAIFFFEWESIQRCVWPLLYLDWDLKNNYYNYLPWSHSGDLQFHLEPEPRYFVTYFVTKNKFYPRSKDHHILSALLSLFLWSSVYVTKWQGRQIRAPGHFFYLLWTWTLRSTSDLMSSFLSLWMH